MSKKEEVVIKETIEKLLELLEVSQPKIKIDKPEDYYLVEIKSDDSAPLIGHRGENLASLQLILRLIVYKKLDSWLKIIVNVNDWREKRAEYLEKMASNFAQKVKFSGKEIQLPFLSSVERRTIHLYLADHPDVVTSSEGEGSQRRLVIKPKKSK